MLRALNAMHYSSDESIDEDLAFNSEDEAKYGKFFNGKSSSVSGCDRSITMTKLLAMEVPVPKGSGDSDVVTIDVLGGTKMVISSACLDIPSNDFRQLRLMFRCIYEDEDMMPWTCISNHLNTSQLLPSVLLSLEVVGPCLIEWKVQSSELKHAGIMNVFGQIVPTDAIGGSVLVNKDSELRDSTSLKQTAKSEARKDLVHKSVEPKGYTNQEAEPVISNKRKLRNDDHLEDRQTTKATSPNTTEASQESNNKLTKKQRKQLAEEKTKQLEETLAAARDTKSESKSKKKKKKKSNKPDDEEEPISKPTSLTRERRLPGGIVVSDILIGTGTTVSSGRKISLHYTGKLMNGKVFDKNHSRTQPLQFRQGTGEVIRGLERGLEGMRVGGERLITVPAALGYGEKGAGVDIPPDSDLLFEVKVLKVG
jgi:FKBP-type peptidyl-prolyl cis-trans isomerase